MYKYLCMVAALIALGLWYICSENLAAMETCQQTRSYDTCAYNILR